jgi:hypothetical protein
MNNLSNLAYFRRGIALATVVLTAIVAVGNVLGAFPSPWRSHQVLFFGGRTGLESTPVALLGEYRNPLLVGIIALAALFLLPRERDYIRTASKRGAEIGRITPPFPLASAVAVPLAVLFFPAFVHEMGRTGAEIDVAWWVTAGGLSVVLPIGALAGPPVPWQEGRIPAWTTVSMAVAGTALAGLLCVGWAALAVLAGALVAASPRYILPPVLWTLRKIFPAREPLPGSPPVR